MATLKIKKDDMVQVIAGKDKGKEGKVLRVDKKNGTVVVEGVNKVFKHSKPSMANQAGGIIEMEAPRDIWFVKLMLWVDKWELILIKHLFSRRC